MKHMFDCDKMETKKRRFMTKADIWFLFVLLTMALVLLFFFHLSRTQGSFAQISYDGRVLHRISLSQTETKYYLLTENTPVQDMEDSLLIRELSEEEWAIMAGNMPAKDSDYNVFLCENGAIRMLQSNCPDLICVHHSAVSKTGENIICLPHKIVIEISGRQDHEVDGVVY